MDASTAATIAAASVTAVGTGTLAWVGIAQSRREAVRRKREETPRLLLTGARPGWHGKPAGWYRVELANLSPHLVWIDGVYADWRQDEGDGRIPFKGKGTYPNHRTPLAPGGWVKLVNVFTEDDSAEVTTEGREAEIVVEFFYALTGTRKHQCAWRIRGGAHSVMVNDLKAIPRWRVEQQSALASQRSGTLVGFEAPKADSASASTATAHAFPVRSLESDEGER